MIVCATCSGSQPLLARYTGGETTWGSTPPVFIVVCNNVSKAVFDYIAGQETEHQHTDGEPVVAGGDALPLFGNVKDQRWLPRSLRTLAGGDANRLAVGVSVPGGRPSATTRRTGGPLPGRKSAQP
jgi:hypothetical protein